MKGEKKKEIGLLVYAVNSGRSGGGYFHLRADVILIDHRVKCGLCNGRGKVDAPKIDATDQGLQECDHCHGDGEVMRHDVNNVTNPSSSAYDRTELQWADFTITSQGNNNDTPRKLYGFGIEYRDVFAVDQRRAEAMAKCLKTINAKLDAMREERGNVADFAEYVGRVAEAIGKQTRILYEQNRQRFATMHSEIPYRFLSIGAGVDHVRWMTHRWEQGEESQIQGVRTA